MLANRLSEVRGWRVLLLEAGPDESEASDVPALATFLQLGKFDWAYKPEPLHRSHRRLLCPQPHALRPGEQRGL